MQIFEKFRFSWQISKNFQFFQTNFRKILNFSGKNFRMTYFFSHAFTQKFPFIQTKLPFTAKLCANLSILLEKLSLSSILPLAYMTSFVGRGGALVETITFNRRVVGSTPALAAM